jgi:hypothetical protein
VSELRSFVETCRKFRETAGSGKILEENAETPGGEESEDEGGAGYSVHPSAHPSVGPGAEEERERVDSWVYDLQELFPEQFKGTKEDVGLVYLLVSFFVPFGWLDRHTGRATWMSLLGNHVRECKPKSFFQVMLVRLVAIARNDITLLAMSVTESSATHPEHLEVSYLLPTWEDRLLSAPQDEGKQGKATGSASSLDRREMEKQIRFLCALSHSSASSFSEENCPSSMLASPLCPTFLAIFSLTSNHETLIKRSVSAVMSLFGLDPTGGGAGAMMDVVLTLMGNSRGLVGLAEALLAGGEGGVSINCNVLGMLNLKNECSSFDRLNSRATQLILEETCKFFGWKDTYVVLSLMNVCQFRIHALAPVLGWDTKEVDGGTVFLGEQQVTHSRT